MVVEDEAAAATTHSDNDCLLLTLALLLCDSGSTCEYFFHQIYPQSVLVVVIGTPRVFGKQNSMVL